MEIQCMKKLLITADDFGYSTGRNSAIVECYRQKAISRASLLINGVRAEEAAKMARKHGIPTGLHVNITEGLPVSPPDLVKSLLSADTGVFVGKYVFRKMLADGLLSMEEVHIEMAAQLKKFKTLLGKQPTHVDGHQHIHVLPGICEVFANLFANMTTRLPLEPLCETYDWLESPRREFYLSVNQDCEMARDVFRKKGLYFPQCFVGLTTLGRDMTYKHSTRQILRAFDRVERDLSCVYNSGESKSSQPSHRIKSGPHPVYPMTCELMVHPGYKTHTDNSLSQSELCILAGCGIGPDEFDQSSEREQELNVITGRLFRDWIQEEGIQVVEKLVT